MNPKFMLKLQRSAGMDHETGGNPEPEKQNEKGRIDSSEHISPESGGGEIGRTIEVRDSTERTSSENVSNHNDLAPNISNEKDRGPEITVGRDKSAKSPDSSKGLLGTTEKNHADASSDSANISRKRDYIISKGYLDNAEVTNLIRCGSSTCRSFGPPKQEKELKAVSEKVLRVFEKALGKIARGKAINPYQTALKELTRPSALGSDEADIKEINRKLDLFIYEWENPEAMERYKAFQLPRLPDLESPDALNKSQFKQRREYLDYNVY